MSLQQSSLDVAGDWDTETCRASVFDVCLQLGALDNDSLVAEWMFNDPSTNGDSSLHRPDRITRFTRFIEMISSESIAVPDGNVPNGLRRRRLFSFSIRAPAFARRLCSRPKRQSIIDKTSHRRPSHAAGSNRVSLRRGLFFKRTTDLRETDTSANERTSNTIVVSPSSHIPTNRRTFFQRKSTIRSPSQTDSSPVSQPHSDIGPVGSDSISIDTPIHSRFTQPQVLDHSHTIQQDDGDLDWEEIEAIPNLHPTPDEGSISPANSSLPLASQRQSYRTTQSDLDSGVVVYDTARYKFTLASPRDLFRRLSKQGHHNLSSQRRRGSSTSQTITGSSSSKRSSAGTSSTPRKRLRISTKSKHSRKSGSRPPSPFVLLTSRNNDIDPGTPTTQIVFSSDTPPRPASESLFQDNTSCMGYHHQFFVQAQEEAFKTSLNRPVSPTAPVQNQAIFLTQKGKSLNLFYLEFADDGNLL